MALRLLAEDAEDLQILSAALQDAVARVGDLSFDPAARTLTVALNRYRWEDGRRAERVRAALQLGAVLSVRSRNLRLGARDAVVAVLEIGFEPGAEPGGAVVIRLAGDGEVRAEVEVLDALLTDVSDPWPARREPRHPA